MSIERRLRRLEGPQEPDRCPACNDRIIFIEEHEGGAETYPAGEPCPECWGKPLVGRSGPVRFILTPCAAEPCAICG